MAKKKKKGKRKPQKKKIPISQTFIVKEISHSVSGVIPIATFENLRPTYTMTVQPKRKSDPNKIFDYIESLLHQRFDNEANLAKADLIEKQNANLRFRKMDGKKYPSVTSILDWDKTWRVSEDELNQYAARGKIIDKLLKLYFETAKWANPYKLVELKEEVSILMGGSLGFSWQNCSHEKFIKQYRRKFAIKKMNTVVFNDEHLYSGEIDAEGEYEGRPAIIDFKTGGYDMCQLAAYAVCEKDIEVLVVCPVGPTDNVSGYMRPVVCDTIQEKFNEFLKARAKFKKRFGI